MKLANFEYEKKPGEVSKRSVLLLHSTDTFNEGIDTSKLSDAEKQELFTIQREYEESLKKYMKHYRRFLKERIIEDSFTLVEG